MGPLYFGRCENDLREHDDPIASALGLSRHKVDTAHDVQLLISSGTQYRTIASTKYNRESSRSHAVFELTLTQVGASIALVSRHAAHHGPHTPNTTRSLRSATAD